MPSESRPGSRRASDAGPSPSRRPAQQRPTRRRSGSPQWRPFLATYASDLMAGDLSGAAARWRPPALWLSAFGVTRFRHVADVMRHLAGVLVRYRQVGALSLRPELIDARALAADLFSVEAEWVLLDRHGAPLGREFTRQIVQRDADGDLGIELMLTVHAHCLMAGHCGVPKG